MTHRHRLFGPSTTLMTSTILADVGVSSANPYTPAMTDLRQDIELLAEVCGQCVARSDGRQQTEEGDKRWRNGVASHPDPVSLVSVAEQHGVLPLLARALSAAGIACETAQARARQIAFRNLALAAELVKLTSALREHKIPVLAYKGPVLGQQLYGDATLRQFRDLDILVAPADALRTSEVLRQLGYEDVAPFSPSLLRKHVASQCEWQMAGADTGTLIELHWALFPRYASFDLSFDELRRASVEIAIAGEAVRAPALDHLALALSAHGTKHFWYRLGWLVDFALVMRDRADADADQLLGDAVGRGMRRILLTSVALANRVLKMKLTTTFKGAIEADPVAQVLANRMQQSLFSEARPEDLLTENVSFLRTRERWSDRAKIVSRLAFTPGPEEWRLITLPEWAGWLYRPLRMARAARYAPRIVQRAFSFRKP